MSYIKVHLCLFCLNIYLASAVCEEEKGGMDVVKALNGGICLPALSENTLTTLTSQCKAENFSTLFLPLIGL